METDSTTSIGRTERGIDRLHAAIFGGPASEPIHQFIRQLSWSTVGGILGAGTVFLVNILAGRWLGPSEYGTVTLALVFGQIFALASTAGLDVASARFVPRTADQARQGSYMSSALFPMFALVVVAAVAALVLSSWIGGVTGARREVVLAGIAFGVVFAVRTALDRQVAAVRAFRFQSITKVVEGVTALIVLTVLVQAAGLNDYLSLVFALGGGGVLALVLAAGRLRGFLAIRAVSRRDLQSLARFGTITLLHAATPAGFVYLDKVIIKAQLGSGALGLYAAYYAGAFLVTAQLLAIITNVLFPIVSSAPDKRPIVLRLRRIRRLGILPLVALLFGIVSAVLLLFGSAFEYSLTTALLAAGWGATLFFNGLMTVVTVTHSERSYLLTALWQGVRSLVFLAGMGIAVATDSLTINLVMGLMILIEIIDSVNLDTIINRHVLTTVAVEAGHVA